MKILVIGESCIDKFVYGHSKRLSPEVPVPVFVPEKVETNYGMAGNVIENLKALCEFKVELITQESEISKTRFVDDKSNHMFLRVDEGEEKINKFKLTEELKSKIVESDIVVVSDYDKGFLSMEDIIEIGKLSKLSIIDAKKKLNREVLDNFNFIKLNENEWKNNSDLVEGFEKKLLITLGVKGCLYDGNIYSSPNPQVTMDVSGAGDTFTSAFILKWSETKNINKSIEFANSMASIVVSKRGVKTP